MQGSNSGAVFNKPLDQLTCNTQRRGNPGKATFIKPVVIEQLLRIHLDLSCRVFSGKPDH